MKTLTRTEEEAVILSSIIGHLRPSKKVYSLLEKINAITDEELVCEDYDRVTFNFDFEKNQITNIQIEYN